MEGLTKDFSVPKVPEALCLRFTLPESWDMAPEGLEWSSSPPWCGALTLSQELTPLLNIIEKN